jgi:hypothetical protein
MAMDELQAMLEATARDDNVHVGVAIETPGQRSKYASRWERRGSWPIDGRPTKPTAPRPRTGYIIGPEHTVLFASAGQSASGESPRSRQDGLSDERVAAAFDHGDNHGV